MPSLTPLSAHNEFAEGASTWPEDLDRRDFVKLMGASAALAGLGACGRAPTTFVPYVRQPEEIVPGNALFYATAMPVEGYARGILVEAHEGRPTKIEGNPRQADSLGATDAITQASILSLYDPDRSRTPRAKGQPASWTDFESGWLERRPALLASGGRGFALLTEPTTSPTLLREIHRLLDRFPAARWHQHTPLTRYDLAGVQSDCDPAQADVIVAIESDFLHRHPAALRYARAFARRRRIEHGTVEANRLYALEAGWSLTGAMADHRLAASPPALRRVLNAVATMVEGNRGAIDPSLTPQERRFAATLAGDLQRHAPRVLCLAGAEQPAEIQQWARAINRRLGGGIEKLSPAVRSDADPRCVGDLAALADAMGRGEVSTLAVLGSNPVYTGSADLDLAEKLAAVEYSVHLGGQEDETALRCRWHLPESHYLEAWGDLRGFGGGAVVQQPLIEPLYGTRSSLEIVRLLADGVAPTDYDLVRETWQGRLTGADFEERWSQGLNRGWMEEAGAEASRAASPAVSDMPILPAGVETAGSPTLILRPDPVLADGRWANNGWLQELPRPFTALVWDNALLVAPGFAAERQLANGDRVRLGHDGRFLDVPIWILPGQAVGCVELHLGGGRSRGGATGTGRGVNAYLLRTRNHLWEIPDLSCEKTSGAEKLVSTQHHFTMEGRDPARLLTLQDLPRLTKEKSPTTSLYPAWAKKGHAWGMSIDLSTCFGCSACVVACQAENNIPVVGKEQVSRGREMHWIRIDRYVAGDESNPRMLSQPVPCMHCENAPCELVCPVGATVHSSEGLNEMVYNRCVGTRYCSNNCPYKVRRFNFFDFQAPVQSPVHLQENPNVTVRARGVMEKCTYCVQRINAGRIAAERDNRPLRDGEIRTACQQACPAEAIVFGDLADPQSAVSRRKRETADYALLGELNTRPRTTYLAKIINPAPESAAAASV
jgi:Fe-S-cluster-containing dehydrogenase component/anaerobic selenocysteine-containing dehydrogenase